jgi:hypothetical protein
MTSLSQRLRQEAARVPARSHPLTERVIDGLKVRHEPVPFPPARRRLPVIWIAAAAALVVVSVRYFAPATRPQPIRTEPGIQLPWTIADFGVAAAAALNQPDPLERELEHVRSDLTRAGKFLLARVPTL